MKYPIPTLFITLLLLLLMQSCHLKGQNKSQKESEDPKSTTITRFDPDSAYDFVSRQVLFGPRVPGTASHQACGDYLSLQLKRWGAKVTQQYGSAIGYDGKKIPIRNIIGSFLPDQTERILLFAHWDTRAWADRDPDPSLHHTPIDGANDGASGVGVLLELARQISIHPLAMGVDIIFFDTEDQGTPEFHTSQYSEDTWCLGSTYWAKNPHIAGYKARFGILLDMVGATNATFFQEQLSLQFASPIVEKVWKQASLLGHGNYFRNEKGGYITDDHLPVNLYRKIPSIDIIELNRASDSGFGGYWHTTMDNISVIDKQTLNAVGQTVSAIIYNEK